jgi:hypothetical protein
VFHFLRYRHSFTVKGLLLAGRIIVLAVVIFIVVGTTLIRLLFPFVMAFFIVIAHFVAVSTAVAVVVSIVVTVAVVVSNIRAPTMPLLGSKLWNRNGATAHG